MAKDSLLIHVIESDNVRNSNFWILTCILTIFLIHLVNTPYIVVGNQFDSKNILKY